MELSNDSCIANLVDFCILFSLSSIIRRRQILIFALICSDLWLVRSRDKIFWQSRLLFGKVNFPSSLYQFSYKQTLL
jgi:hypothetical protein